MLVMRPKPANSPRCSMKSVRPAGARDAKNWLETLGSGLVGRRAVEAQKPGVVGEQLSFLEHSPYQHPSQAEEKYADSFTEEPSRSVRPLGRSCRRAVSQATLECKATDMPGLVMAVLQATGM